MYMHDDYRNAEKALVLGQDGILKHGTDVYVELSEDKITAKQVQWVQYFVFKLKKWNKSLICNNK